MKKKEKGDEWESRGRRMRGKKETRETKRRNRRDKKGVRERGVETTKKTRGRIEGMRKTHEGEEGKRWERMRDRGNEVRDWIGGGGASS